MNDTIASALNTRALKVPPRDRIKQKSINSVEAPLLMRLSTKPLRYGTDLYVARVSHLVIKEFQSKCVRIDLPGPVCDVTKFPGFGVQGKIARYSK